MNENDYLNYWAKLKDEVKTFGTQDDHGVIFGSRTERFGHDYKVLPVVPEKELVEFERRTGLDLPLEYRTYLQSFGAGGAGPNYGIYDFRETVQNEDFSVPFPLTETTYSIEDDYPDDDPIWDLPGLAYICSHGCAIESAIELNGPCPGTVWCESGTDIFRIGSFFDFYKEWADKTLLRLEKFDRLKCVVDRDSLLSSAEKIPFEEIVQTMDCGYREGDGREESYIPEEEIWVYFEDTPGKVVLNRRREMIRIETMMLS